MCRERKFERIERKFKTQNPNIRRRQSNASEENIVIVPEFDLVIGTRLFELYLSLQEFYKLTDANRNNSSTNRIPVNHNISSSDGNTTLSSNSRSNR